MRATIRNAGVGHPLADMCVVGAGLAACCAALIGVSCRYESALVAESDPYPGQFLPYQAAILALALQVIPLLDGLIISLMNGTHRHTRRIRLETSILGGLSIAVVGYSLVAWPTVWVIAALPGFGAIAYLFVRVSASRRGTP